MLFDDQYRCTYDELVNYYPDYYTEVKEMQAVLQAEGQEVYMP